MSRTPGQWTWEPEHGEIGAGDVVVAEIDQITGCEEDGAFIVLACNAHDDLVQALRQLTNEVVGACGFVGTEMGNAMGATIWRVLKLRIEEARAVLERVEGGK